MGATRAARRQGLGRLYSRDDMLRAAKDHGHQASARLLRDWVEHGLVDRSVHWGLGRGKGGSRSGWPQAQRRLWLTVLEHRQQSGGSIAPLCCIPVGLWLYFGDAYVPLRQVQLAMHTWTGAPHMVKSLEEARRGARRFLDQIPGLTLGRAARTRVCDVLAAALYDCSRGLPRDAVDVAAYLTGTLRAADVNPAISAAGPNTPPPEDFCTILAARIVVAQRFAEGPLTIPPSLYLWARLTLQKIAEELGQNPVLATAGGSLPLPARAGSITDRLETACLDLVTMLGLGLILPESEAERTAVGVDGAPALTTRRFWEGVPREGSTVTSTPIVSPLVLPDGTHPITGLRVAYTVTRRRT